MASSSEQPNVPVGPELDNRRIAAALVDLLVPGAILAVLTLAGVPASVPVIAVVALWSGFYAFACESGGGQTLGKRLLGLRVVDARGGQPEMREIAVRALVGIADRNIVGLIAMLVNGDHRQRLGDMAARTYVTTADAKRDLPAAPARPVPRRAPAPLPVAASPLPANVPVVSEAPAVHVPVATEIDPDPVFFESPGRRVGQPVVAHEAPNVAATEPTEPEIETYEPAPYSATEPDETPRPRIELDFDAPVPEISFGVSGGLDDGYDDELPDYAPFGGPPSEEPMTLPPAPTRGPMSLIEQAGEADRDEPEIFVKPIETVSAMDLIMQDAEQRNLGS